MYKRILSVCLAAAYCCCLVGCGSKSINLDTASTIRYDSTRDKAPVEVGGPGGGAGKGKGQPKPGGGAGQAAIEHAIEIEHVALVAHQAADGILPFGEVAHVQQWDLGECVVHWWQR